MDLVQHTIPPIYNETSNTLLLGTMPSPKSRAAGFYYAHPKNRFWPTLAAVYNEPVTRNNHERRSLILRHHLALWDVLDSCEICGAADASIRNAQPNDIPALIAKTRIVQVFCIGQMAGQLYRRFLESKTGFLAKSFLQPAPQTVVCPLTSLYVSTRMYCYRRSNIDMFWKAIVLPFQNVC